MKSKKTKNLLLFAGAIIAIFALGNIVEYSSFLWWKAKYGADLNAADYSADLMLPINDFHDVYQRWPGPSGPIDEKFIHELKGDLDATINSRHINFYKKNNLDVMEKNKFGYNFQFQIDEKSPAGFFVENLTPDPQTGLPTK